MATTHTDDARSNEAMKNAFAFRTDTATLAIFDVAALAHRKDQAADWWSVPGDELLEVNRGNMLLIALGVDGVYDIEFSCHQSVRPPHHAIDAVVKCASGKLHVGPGEDLPADGFEPDDSDYTSGRSFAVAPSSYTVSVWRLRGSAIAVSITPGSSEQVNTFRRPLVLKD